MIEASVVNWLPVVQRDWHDEHTRRARIQDILYVETLRLVDPTIAATRETNVLGADPQRQSAERVQLLGDMLKIVQGRRNDGLRLRLVNDFEIDEDLEMEHIDAAEDRLMRQPSPEAAVDQVRTFLRRLQVQQAA